MNKHTGRTLRTVFRSYAQFYDSFYSNKDYDGETAFLLRLASKLGVKRPASVLDMGCGTGGHVIPLARKKIHVCGFDRAYKMIALAKEKVRRARQQPYATLALGDVVDYRDGRQYDLVISMFAVMGYLTETKDFLAGLRTARMHLKRDGLFVFDVWFGPAVLHSLPQARIQEFEQDGKRVLRLVQPELDFLSNTVTVNYTLLHFLANAGVEEVTERHRMRYFFLPEVQQLADQADLMVIALVPFKDETRSPSLDDWNVSFVVKRKS